MKISSILLAVAGLLLFLGSCASNQASDATCACAEAGVECQCEATPDADVDADAVDMECAGCTVLMVGGTGWCAECGAGYNNGQLVGCTGACSANPGGMPCAACVQ